MRSTLGMTFMLLIVLLQLLLQSWVETQLQLYLIRCVSLFLNQVLPTRIPLAMANSRILSPSVLQVPKSCPPWSSLSIAAAVSANVTVPVTSLWVNTLRSLEKSIILSKKMGNLSFKGVLSNKCIFLWNTKIWSKFYWLQNNRPPSAAPSHWGTVMHACVTHLGDIGWINSLSPVFLHIVT